MSGTIDDDLRCQEIVELVTDYLEGAMPEDTRVRFEHHLAQCPACVTYVEQMRLTIGLTPRLGSDGLSVGARRDLVEAFRAYWDNPAHEGG